MAHDFISQGAFGFPWKNQQQVPYRKVQELADSTRRKNIFSGTDIEAFGDNTHVPSYRGSDHAWFIYYNPGPPQADLNDVWLRQTTRDDIGDPKFDDTLSAVMYRIRFDSFTAEHYIDTETRALVYFPNVPSWDYRALTYARPKIELDDDGVPVDPATEAHSLFGNDLMRDFGMGSIVHAYYNRDAGRWETDWYPTEDYFCLICSNREGDGDDLHIRNLDGDDCPVGSGKPQNRFLEVTPYGWNPCTGHMDPYVEITGRIDDDPNTGDPVKLWAFAPGTKALDHIPIGVPMRLRRTGQSNVGWYIQPWHDLIFFKNGPTTIGPMTGHNYDPTDPGATQTRPRPSTALVYPFVLETADDGDKYGTDPDGFMKQCTYIDDWTDPLNPELKPSQIEVRNPHTGSDPIPANSWGTAKRHGFQYSIVTASCNDDPVGG